MSNETGTKKDTYQVDMACTNCGYSGREEIRKGVEALRRTCPNCGCNTLVRSEVKRQCGKRDFYGSTLAEVTDLFFNGRR